VAFHLNPSGFREYGPKKEERPGWWPGRQMESKGAL
jgi:hypothetical protein